MLNRLKERFGFSEGTDGSSLDIEVRHSKQINFLFFVIGGLLLLIGIIGVSYTSIANKLSVTVELPPSIYKEPSMKVGNGWANDFYMRVWGDWLINETANFNSGTIKEKFNSAIRFFSQDKVSDYTGQLGALSNLVIRNQLKQDFSIKKVDATYYEDPELKELSSDDQEVRGAVFVYHGIATQSLGNSPLPDRECQYTISIKIEGGHLYGNSYNTDCFK